jgi:hypothetical protein
MIEIWDGQTDLRPLAEAWAAETGIDADIDCGMEDLQLMLKSPDSDVLVLGEPYAGNPRRWLMGAMGIAVQKVFHTTETYSAVRYWYVLPEFRFLAKGLVDAGKKWSREKGCVKMMICSNKLTCPSDDF